MHTSLHETEDELGFVIRRSIDRSNRDPARRRDQSPQHPPQKGENKYRGGLSITRVNEDVDGNTVPGSLSIDQEPTGSEDGYSRKRSSTRFHSGIDRSMYDRTR